MWLLKCQSSLKSGVNMTFLASFESFQLSVFISFQFISMYADKYSTDTGFIKQS